MPSYKITTLSGETYKVSSDTELTPQEAHAKLSSFRSSAAPVTADRANPVIGATRQIESAGDVNAVSPKGATGEMQVMPGTSRDPGYGITPSNGTPEDTARVGREYRAMLAKKYTDPDVANIAYNWGPGNTDKWLAAGGDPNKLPAEARNYPKLHSRAMDKAGGVQPTQTSGAGPVTQGQPDITPPQQDLPTLQQTIDAQGGKKVYPNAGYKFLEGVIGGGAKLLNMSSKLGPAAIGNQIASYLKGEKPQDLFRDYITKYDETKAERGGWGLAGELGVDVAATAVPIARAGQLATKGVNMIAPEVGRLAPVVGDILANMGYAGYKGKVAENKSYTEAAKDAVEAGAGAAAGHGAFKVFKETGKALSKPFSQAGQKLVDARLPTTIGQAYGPTSKAAAFEEGAKYFPFVGGAVEGRQRELTEGLIKQRATDALRKAGLKPVYGSDKSNLLMVDEAQRGISKLYDDVVPHTYMTPNEGARAIVNVSNNIDRIPFVSAAHRRHFSREVETIADELYQHTLTPRNGRVPLVSGRTLRDIDIRLGDKARKYMQSGNPEHEALGQAYRYLQHELRAAYRATDPKHMMRLRNANAAFKDMIPLEAAVTKSVKKPGQLPDAATLLKETRAAHQKPSDVDLAAAVIQPEIVTHQQGRMYGGLPLGLAAFSAPWFTVPAVAAARAAYSKTGQKILLKGAKAAQAARKGYTGSRLHKTLGASVGGQAGARAAEDED